ncbi:MAG: HAD-IIB family hydrolase [Lachnospiraceae bacterium]|nr:HAD-IIB family hydrolase [Lachnospiraceae bacterium]
MVEIIYLDIDGILRDEQKGVPDSAAWTIGQCRKYGIRIVICTGRSSGMVQEDVMALQTDGMISGGGCYIQYRGREAQLVQKWKWNGRWYLELLPKGCNKGTAVYRLNKELGILKSRSMSFGDGVNDIDMMKATGVAVAVGSGDMRIRKYASSVCEAAAEDGIYKELVRRNIIHPWERSAVL